MKIRNLILFPFIALALSTQVGCAPSSGSDSESEAAGPVLPDTAKVDPANPHFEKPVETNPGNFTTDVLLFNGAGISTSDWQSTEQIIKGMGLSYKLVNSAKLDSMSVDDMATFGMFLVPGGTSGGITSGLKATTRLRVRQAVRDRGVAYLGICAGAFVAVEAGAEGDELTNYGFPVVEDKHLPMWYPNGNTSAIAAVVPVTFPGGKTRQLVWYGGPSTPEWKGGVIARYSNGKPAMSQTWFHKGWVVISGPHPEAPQGWRNSAGKDSDGLDYDIMEQLVQATLDRKPLPTYN